MKDAYIKVKMTSQDKHKLRQDAEHAGFDTISAYVVYAIRICRTKRR